MITSNKQDLGFFTAPNLVPWLVLKVNSLEIRAWIVTDEFCRIRLHLYLTGGGGYWEREDDNSEKVCVCVARGEGGDYSREAIGLNISV